MSGLGPEVGAPIERHERHSGADPNGVRRLGPRLRWALVPLGVEVSPAVPVKQHILTTVAPQHRVDVVPVALNVAAIRPEDVEGQLAAAREVRGDDVRAGNP